MRQSKPQSQSVVAGTKRLQQLAAAFAAFRRAHGPGRRIPLGLRTSVAAALEAGESAGAIQKACGVSWIQTKRWRSAAQTDGVTLAPQVLLVVDRESAAASSSSGDGIELRIGAWHVRINRVVD